MDDTEIIAALVAAGMSGGLGAVRRLRSKKSAIESAILKALEMQKTQEGSHHCAYAPEQRQQALEQRVRAILGKSSPKDLRARILKALTEG